MWRALSWCILTERRHRAINDRPYAHYVIAFELRYDEFRGPVRLPRPHPGVRVHETKGRGRDRGGRGPARGPAYPEGPRCARNSDLICAGKGELDRLLGCRGRKLAERCHALGAGEVILKRGIDGAAVSDGFGGWI